MKKFSEKKITVINAGNLCFLALTCLFVATFPATGTLFAEEPSPSGKRAVAEGEMSSVPGVPPGKLEFLEVGKTDLIRQKTAKEMMVAGTTDAPQRSALAIPSFSNTYELDKTDFTFESTYYFGETIKENQSKGGIFPASDLKIIGTILTVKNTAAAAKNIYSRINRKISSFKENSGDRITHVDPETLPEEIKSSIENLSEVKDVAVSIPGAEYVVAREHKNENLPEYNVDDNIFTIDTISLEKDKNGKFVSRVPPEAAKHIERKLLCFSTGKDLFGKTIEMKLEEGDIHTLATVLAMWSKYSGLGFSFDEKTEKTVVKSLIKVQGVGVSDSVVRLENTTRSSDCLEEEILKIVGDDSIALDKIHSYIKTGAPAQRREDHS